MKLGNMKLGNMKPGNIRLRELKRPLRLGLLLGLLGLAACQTTGKTTGTTNTAPAKAPAAAVQTPEAAPAAPAPARPPQVVARPPEPVEPPIDDNPNQLMGLDRSGLTALLGKPDLVRREQPAEIWQYVAANCVFDVVLYDSGQRYRVTYLEARNAAADRLAPRPCLNQILRARQSAPVS